MVLRPNRSLGFSLIELLILISIVAILATLLFTQVQKARSLALESKCLSNMRQMGIAMNQYADEHNMLFCPRYQTSGDPVWEDYLNEYLGLAPYPYRFYNSPIWWCPSAKKFVTLERHYAVNIFMYDASSKALWQRKKLAPPFPSRIVLIGEMNENGEVLQVTNPTLRSNPDYTGQAKTSFRMSHPNGSANYLFVDGHVENRVGSQTQNIGSDSIWRWWDD